MFVGSESFEHGSPARVGVVLVNLGTPEEPTPKALRRYLREFLWDRRVIELSRPLWWLILNFFILPRRSVASAKLYREIWTEQGSPLLLHTKAQAEKLSMLLKSDGGNRFVVAYGMRYGNPSVEAALNKVKEQGATRILLLPLYPQYSGATGGSTFDAVAQVLTRWRWVPELRTVMQYHDNPLYLEALTKSISEHWSEHGRAERLLFSFHGIPKRYFLAGDPYHCQCLKTGRLVAQMLELEPEQYQVAFQSRFGREWIEPYTDQTLKAWAAEGVKSVEVICPGFSADCLETLEEINVTARRLFFEQGGEKFHYIPALNDCAEFIETLLGLVLRNTKGWISEGEYEKKIDSFG